MTSNVIVDIDGTLSLVGARVECLKSDPPDWDHFYARCGEDLPNPKICDLVSRISEDYRIVLCSGRRESCRGATMEWLANWGIPWNRLLLRKDGDFRHDTIVKPEMIKAYGLDLNEIAFVLEDRNSMVKKWRELGLICLQVAEGDF